MNSPRNTRPVLLAIVLTALVAGAIGAFIVYQIVPGARSPASLPAEAKQTVSVVNGQTLVTLATAVQSQSDIRIEPLRATQHQAETIAYGTVLDLQPLLDLRTRYLAALADADVAKATVAASQNQAERDRILYHDNQNVSLKTYQAAQAASLSDQAKLQAATRNLENVRGAVVQQLGATVGRWVQDAQSPQLARLLDRRESLLRVTLPLGDHAVAPARIQVAGNSSQRYPANLVSPAAQSDPTVQGSAFIYRTAAPIVSGTNVAVFLPTSGHTVPGIVIPTDAVVWHGGGPWVYVQVQPDTFARRPVGQHESVDGGLYVSDGFKAGERVVVRGAQLLLSEELRPPPGGAACKDPECD